MKKIAVLTYDFSNEYTRTVVDGITKSFKTDNNYQVIVSQIRRPYCDEGLYTYHFWSNTELLKSKEIDGYIIVAGSFTPEIKNNLKGLFKANPKPIISVGLDLGFKNSYYTFCNCNRVTNDLIKHLKNKHHCQKIAYFSGNQTGSKESQARYEAFLKIMKKYNLEINEDWIFHGNFLPYFAQQTMQEKFKTKEDIPFDAIVCTNDLTAVGIIDACKEMNIRVPEDLIVTGFDNSSLSTMNYPTMSTIEPNIEEQGFTAGEALKRILNGEKIPRKIPTELSVLYRQSCGCIKLGSKELMHKNQRGKTILESDQYKFQIRKFYAQLNEFDRISPLFDQIRSKSTLSQVAQSMGIVLPYAYMDNFMLCLYDSPIDQLPQENFVCPDNVNLEMLVKDNYKTIMFEPDISFNPKKQLFPELIMEDNPGIYLLHTINSGTLNYGYVLTKFSSNNYTALNVFMKIITQSLTQAIEYTKTVSKNQELEQTKIYLVERNSSLNQQSRVDDLTQILNRRGFMEYAQRLIDFSVEMGNSGLVFFADMDGLKGINDTYGHDMGDLAIKTEAEVLKEAFRQADVIGRLSGDEFSIVAPGMSLKFYNTLHKKIDTLNAKYSKLKNLPFTLSLSLGAVEFSEDEFNLKNLLAKADDNLYEEKKIKHAKRGK